MPISKEFVAEFKEEHHYHVFCKSVGDATLFKNDADKYHFLNCYFDFLSDFVDTYAYNLLDNHFHFILKVKSQCEIINSLNNYPEEFLIDTQKKFLAGNCKLHTLIAKQFQRLNIKYTDYFNKSYTRKGHLFNRPFKRKEIDSDEYLTRVFVYVHANELHHKISKSYEDCKWSSYNDILGKHKTRINREEVLNWFGGSESFITIHKEMALEYSNYVFG